MKLIKTLIPAFIKKKSYFYWFPRFSGLLLIPGFLFDIDILVLFQSFILLHASLGLEVIIEDYLHIEIIKLQCLSLIKVLLILLVNLNILYLL
uniref:Succinate:cytochrome c oxidoreductase subunit 4 n=1 Tax=Pyropia fucicola TaxID=144551 RepID=A0A060DD95_9RHOD|nr:succinate:cytochrome c oxidoreductase subunit 4 [Neopyropia fucicola]AIB08112.1 succinate:cytochrome c oxidoreductase subunit 4 [Neopyropia fucicola]